MNALKLRDLLLLLLSASVSAEVQNCVTQTKNSTSDQPGSFEDILEKDCLKAQYKSMHKRFSIVLQSLR
uniref:Putative secreted protein n=1 Tax=Ixodes ricinus TaxID=34613 RepID=A0A6B0TZS4_IXORI